MENPNPYATVHVLLQPSQYTSWAENTMEEHSRIVEAIGDDSKTEFVRLLHSPRLRDLEPPFELIDFARVIFETHAFNCADAVLFGETSRVLDQYFGFPRRDGWTALHQAALTPNSFMMEKLIYSGLYDPNVRTDLDEDDPKALKQALPLTVALHSIKRREKYRPPEWSSAVGLLSSLYILADNKLDAIRLLALNTRDFQQEFFSYAKQGKMIEVAALLLAAADKLLPLRIPERRAPFISFKEIKDFLQRQPSNGWSSFAEWKETLNLLDIYDTMANQLISCAAIKPNRRCGMEVATLLQAHGFDKNLRIDRPDNSSLNLSVPHFNLPWKFIQNIFPAKWMNRESKQPSMLIQPVSGKLHPQSFARNMCTTSAHRTLPMKSWNAMKKLISNKRSPLMRILKGF